MVDGRGTTVPAVDLRPQSVLLTFFGDYVDTPGAAVASSSVLEVLAAAGVGVAATRATLSRMTRRGLLARVARGRRAYFALTEFGRRTVAEGRQRAHDDADGPVWDGRWTLVGFSLPEDAQRERHDLRSRLGWAGFGPVQAGLWAAPREVDVDEVLAGSDLTYGVKVFRAEPVPVSQSAALAASAFDLPAIAEVLRSFARRWHPVAEAGVGDVQDPLTCRVVLTTDWAQVVRTDPRLPREFLPAGWPAREARALHRSLDDALRDPAERAARERLDLLRP